MHTRDHQLQKRRFFLCLALGFFFLVVAFRISVLMLAPSASHLEMALRPAQKLQVLPASRGAVFDRNGAALVVNKPHYEVGVCYKDFMAFPTTRAYWQGGKRLKEYPRKEKVMQLLRLLERELGLNAQQLEDFVYSQAALTPSQTTKLVENLTSQQYFRLKSMEDFYPGLRVEQVLHRDYPLGSLAGHVIGYVGPCDPLESVLTRQKLASLQAQMAMEDDPIIRESLEQELENLRLRLKNMNEALGKSGVEKQYESLLRGQEGKKVNRVSSSGTVLEELASVLPVPGQNLTLCIDKELQLFAEQLLAENELIREDSPQDPTWVKGGSAIVMNPHNGQILALASYPRFDPQAYCYPSQEKNIPVHHRFFWLENKAAIAHFWNGQWPFMREIYDRKKEEFVWQSKPLSSVDIARQICGPHSPVASLFSKMKSLSKVGAVSAAFGRLYQMLAAEGDGWEVINFLYNRSFDEVYWPKSGPRDLKIIQQRWQELVAALALESEKRVLDQAVGDLKSNFDKMLFIEMCGLFVDETALEGSDSDFIYPLTLEDYRQHQADYLLVQTKIRQLAQEWHENVSFRLWRQQHQKAFLKEKRREEKAERLVARPYIQHLESKRKELFEEFWQSKGNDIETSLICQSASMSDLVDVIEFITQKIAETSAAPSYLQALTRLQKLSRSSDCLRFMRYLKSIRSFETLDKPLWATYPLLGKGSKIRRDLAARIYPRYGLGYMVNKPISHVSAPGSIYKITIAYEGLLQRFQRGLSSWDQLNPFKIVDANYLQKGHQVVGRYLSGKEIPQLYKGGRLPKSQRRYIGEIDLLGAIESSSNPYFSLMARHELQDAPQDILRASLEMGWGQKTGIDLPFERAGALPFDLEKNPTGLYTTAIGQHTLLATPLQAAVMMSAVANGGSVLKPKIVLDTSAPQIIHQLTMPDRIKEYLWEGMRRVVSGKMGTARVLGSRAFGPGTNERKIINRMVPYMIGKTSTAEFVESFGITPLKISQKLSHVWFAGIVFEQPLYTGTAPEKVSFHGKRPELVVLVCLHYGRFGKEAFPIAALLAHKWKETNAQQPIESNNTSKFQGTRRL